MTFQQPLYVCRICKKENNSFTCPCKNDKSFQLMWDRNLRESIQENIRRLKLKATNSNIVIEEKAIMEIQKRYLKKREVRDL